MAAACRRVNVCTSLKHAGQATQCDRQIEPVYVNIYLKKNLVSSANRASVCKYIIKKLSKIGKSSRCLCKYTCISILTRFTYGCCGALFIHLVYHSMYNFPNNTFMGRPFCFVTSAIIDVFEQHPG